MVTKIYCPKCFREMDIDEESLVLPILCQGCGHEFYVREGAENVATSATGQTSTISEQALRSGGKGREAEGIRARARDFWRVAMIFMVIAALCFVAGIVAAANDAVSAANGVTAEADFPSAGAFSACWFFLKASGVCYVICQLLYIRANTEK